MNRSLRIRSPRSLSLLAPLSLMATLGALPTAGCADDDGFVREPLSVTVAWSSEAPDLVLAHVMQTPAATQRLLVVPRLCPNRETATITGVTLDGSPLAFERQSLGLDTVCARLSLGNRTIRGGDVLRVTLEDTSSRSTTVETVMPALPASPAIALHALAATRTADGTTWLATPHHGLVGVASDGRVIDYVGVASADPWDPAAQAPQSGAVLALVPAGERALWVSSAATGISWFDPGSDVLLRSDDVWTHGQPTATPKLADELAQTAIAIAADPTDDNGLWVATLNGLYHARRVGGRIDFARIADGFAMSLSVDPYGRIWAGFSTQVMIYAPSDNDQVGSAVAPLTPAAGALLVVTPGSDPHDPSSADLRWALEDEDAVTALITDATGAWVGTPYGLGRVSDDALTLQATPAITLGAELAVVDLEPTSDGFWLSARAECEVDRGRLLRVQLDDAGAIEAVVDHSAAGFGERDFAWVHALGNGELLVSTLVPVISALAGDAPTSRGCEIAPATARSADLYVLSPEGRASPFGATF